MKKKREQKIITIEFKKRKLENKLKFLNEKLYKILKYYKYKQKSKGKQLKYLLITYSHAKNKKEERLKNPYVTEAFPIDLKITHKNVMMFILSYLDARITWLHSRYKDFEDNELYLNSITFRFIYD